MNETETKASEAEQRPNMPMAGCCAPWWWLIPGWPLVELAARALLPRRYRGLFTSLSR